MPNVAYPDIEQDSILKKLLCFGLFPESLEKILSSENFGELILSDLTNDNLKNYLLKDTNKPDTSKNRQYFNFSTTPFNLTRNTNTSRKLEIPHPLAYFKLSKEISDNWDIINELIIKDNNSYQDISMIIPKNGQRIILLSGDYVESDDENRIFINNKIHCGKNNRDYIELDKSFNKKLLVKTDISRCFGSIYSHSIPWSLVGKKYSKNKFKNISNEVDSMNLTDEEKFKKNIYDFSNKIESRSREMKDRETNGIPIGPDTSNIISEIILSQIDKKLCEKYAYIRYIDDYHCFVETEEEAKEFLKDLEKELRVYHLELNDKKTEIKNILEPDKDKKKIEKIKNFGIPSNNITEDNFGEIFQLLDLAQEYSIEKNDFKYFRYAILKLKNIHFDETILLENFCKKIFNIILFAPYLLKDCEFILNIAEPKFRKIFIETILLENIEYRRSDVLVFSIYFALSYKIDFEEYQKIENALFKIKDPVSTLMLFLYAKENNKSLNKFYEILKDVFEEEWWIYFYELYREDSDKFNTYLPDFEYSNFYNYLKDENI